MNTKRYLSLLLVFVLIFSSTFSMAAKDSRLEELEGVLNNKEQVNMKPEKPVKLEILPEHQFDENEDVRVIIQLKEKPAISYVEGIEKYTSLSETKRASLESNILNTQRAVEYDLSNKGIKLNVENRMTVAANAFSAIVKGSEIEKIRVNEEVENVFISNEYERPETPQMVTSHDMIGSNYTWDTLGYKGEGMVVAIVDTGIDPSHKDMKISDGVEVKLTKDFVDSTKTVESLPGTYRTKKVPYGYNYYDKNEIILDTSIRSHGMHVAGTVGANGEIKGVAPEAQLLAMKVFSRDPDFPSTYDDIYMKAIDDAIKLGVDVINMSLGSPSGFYQPNGAIDKMITEARAHGVVFSISAGNEAHSTDGAPNGHGYPSINNPDIGLVGSPSLNKDAISVASIENTHMQTNYILYGEGEKAAYSIAGPYALAGEFTDIEFVDAGLGGVEDFEGKDFIGKVALISRGEYAFTDKIMNAQNAGAAVAIVYNHAGGGEELVNMQYPDGEGTIPAAFIAHSHGNAINALVNKTISFPDELMKVPNPNAWAMSDFTSWGTTPTLDVKPEITAPGGQIYSTLEADNYGMMSGTSMAAPHLAGGAALVEQYVKIEHTNISDEQISEFSKILLMNTATPVRDPYGFFYSPRRQGAGLMNLPGALTTGATVINEDGEPKVKLGDFKEKKFDIHLVAKNHSDEDLTYKIEVDVLAEWIHPAGFSFLDVEPLQGVKVTGDKEITLASGASKTISVAVDFSNGIVPGTGTPIRDNMFIEGFVRLIAPTEETVDGEVVEKYPSLVVPYVGFYGDWYGEDSPRILDGMARFDEDSYFGISGIVNQDTAYMGFDPIIGYENAINKLAISPESIEENAHTEINPVLSFMRNAEEVQFNILDKYGNEIRKIKTENWVRKQYDNTQGIWYSYNSDRSWDGKANGEVVEDDKYFYEIKAKPQNGEYQVYKYPVYVDTVAPEIVNFKYEGNKLSWKATDEGLSHSILYIDDAEIGGLAPSEDGIYELEIATEIPEGVKIEIEAYDYAGNVSSAVTNQVAGNTPTMTFTTPEPFALYDTNDIIVEGEALSKEGIKSLVAYLVRDGVALDPINMPFDKEGYFFKEIKDLEDGVYSIRLVATDVFDQKYEIFRYFHVDTTAPVVDMENPTPEGATSIPEELMPGGGHTIILPSLGEAYHRNYLEKNNTAMVNFNEYRAEDTKDIYVKLSENAYIDKDGNLVDSIDIYPLTYYNSEGFIQEYDEDGIYKPQKFQKFGFKMNVFENHGYFEVYVNGNQVYIQDEYGLMERKTFDGTIEFSINVPDGVSEFEIRVVDQAGNETIIER